RRITSSHGALWVESGAKPRKSLNARVWAWSVILISNNFVPFAVLVDDFGFHRGDFARKESVFPCSSSLLVARHGKSVLSFAVDTELRGHVLCGSSHRRIDLRVLFHDQRARRELVAAHWPHAHGFRTASDADIDLAKHNALSDHAHGLNAGRAKSVDGKGRDHIWKTGQDRGNTRHVHALLAFWHSTADGHVFNSVQ